jgi:hypothetical protein
MEQERLAKFSPCGILENRGCHKKVAPVSLSINVF